MGPSGSGKTTLLNVLGGRADGTASGKVHYNGQPQSKVRLCSWEPVSVPALVGRP